MNQHTRIQSPLPFIDVAAQRRRLGTRIDDAIARVLNHCQFINGPEVRELERDLSAFCGAQHSIGVSSGTDALVLILMALGIGQGRCGDLPGLHLLGDGGSRSRWSARRRCSSTCWRADLQPRSRRASSARSRRRSGSTSRRRRVMAVDLFGLPADYEAIGRIAAAARPEGDRRRRAVVRRDLSQPQDRHARRRHGDQLLSRKAARLLRRRRRGVHRRRRSRGADRRACAITARARTATTTCASA